MGRQNGGNVKTGSKTKSANFHQSSLPSVKNDNCPKSVSPIIAIITELNKNTILGTVGDKKTQCLLDTGAEISCISESFLDRVSLNQVQLVPSEYQEVLGVGGTKHKILGKFTTDIVISKTKFSATFHVIPGIKYSVILGCDFMQKHRVSFDFEHNFVKLKNKNENTVGIKLSRSDAGLARVTHSINIPPNSRKDIKVKVSRNKAKGIFLIEPTTSLYNKNLAGAKCLVRIKGRKTVVSIMNVTNNSIFLPVDTVVGTVTAIDQTDVFEIDDKPCSNKPCANNKSCNYNSANPPSCANINVKEQNDTCQHFDLSNSDLTPDQKIKMKAFLEKNNDLFSTSLKDIGKTSMYTHSIETQPGMGPVRLPYYKVNPLQMQVIDEEVKKMLESKIIRESNSMWHSPVVLVKKPNNTYRFAVDYRKLNKITLSISHPLPTLETVFDCIGNSQAQFFSTLDLASGFWQVPMDPKTRHKAAFCVPSGIYEFNRMPFGLKNAPMSFQMLMTKVLGKMNWKQALCFIDDILVFSPTFDQHLIDLEHLFQKLRAANLTLKPEKCHFAQEKVKYLGHILSKNGIFVDKEKTRAVDEFPVPTTQRALRSFLGLCNYYRKFVKNYSKITVPLNELLQKDRKFKWEDKHQEAFEILKRALVTAPMIHYPDMNRTFILTTDASDTALGYILGQKGSDGRERVVCYGGRALRSEERKWGITDKECLAVYEGIMAYKQYLSHSKFDVITDHKSLKWLDKTKNSNSRLYRWSYELSQFQYNIIHRPGRVNQNADALSRREYPVEPSVSGSDTANKQGNQNTAGVAHVKQNRVSPVVGEISLNNSGQSSVQLDSNNDVSGLFASGASQTHHNLETILEGPEEEESEDFERVEVFLSYDQIPSINAANIPNNISSAIDDIPLIDDKQTEGNKQIWKTHEIGKYQKQCNDFKYIYNYLDTGEIPEDEDLARKTILTSDQYQLLNGVLYHIFESRGKKLSPEDRTIIQLAVPTELRQDLLTSYHDSAAGGCHLGIQRSFAALRYKYYWPKCFQDVENHVRTCDVCQRIKVDRHSHPAPLSNMPVNKVFDRWHMDIIGPLPKSKEGFQYILLVVESLSKWSEAIPMETMEASTVAKHLFSQVIARYGAPRILVSDRGRNFMSKLVKALCEMFDITRHHTSAYHPQTNSTCERLNSTLEQILRAYINKEQDNWPSVLPSAMMAIRMSPATQSTQFSPFYLLFGKEMNLPIDTSLIPRTEMGLDGVIFFDQLFKTLGVAREIAGENIKFAQEKSKKRYDQKAKDPNFKVGDWVLLRNMTSRKEVSPKLIPKRLGPYFIQELGPNFTYRLVDTRTQIPMKELINAARLKLYVRPKPKPVKPTKVAQPAGDQHLGSSVGQPKPSDTTDSVNDAGDTTETPAEGGEVLHTGKIIRECHIRGKKHYQFEKSRKWINKDNCAIEDVQDYLIRKAARKPFSHQMKTRSKAREEKQHLEG